MCRKSKKKENQQTRIYIYNGESLSLFACVRFVWLEIEIDVVDLLTFVVAELSPTSPY